MNSSLRTLAVCAVLVVAITLPEASFASLKGAGVGADVGRKGSTIRQRFNARNPKTQSDSSLLRKRLGNPPCESGPDTLSRTQSDALVNGRDAAKQIIDPETKRANIFKSITSALKAMHDGDCFTNEGIFRLSPEKTVIDPLVQESEKNPLEFLNKSHDCNELAGFIKASFRKDDLFDRDRGLYEDLNEKIQPERNESEASKVNYVLRRLAEKLGPEGAEVLKESLKAFQLVIQNKASTRFKDADAFAVAVATSVFPLDTGNNIVEGIEHANRAKDILAFILSKATKGDIAQMGSHQTDFHQTDFQKTPSVEDHQHPQHSHSQISLDDTQSPESSSHSLSSSRAGSRRPSSPTLPLALPESSQPQTEVTGEVTEKTIREKPHPLVKQQGKSSLVPKVEAPIDSAAPVEVAKEAAREKPHPLLKQQGNMSLVHKAEAQKDSATSKENSKIVGDLRAQREWERDTAQLKKDTKYRVRILRGGAKTEIKCTHVTEKSDGIHCYDERDKSTLVIEKSDFRGFRELGDLKGESN